VEGGPTAGGGLREVPVQLEPTPEVHGSSSKHTIITQSFSFPESRQECSSTWTFNDSSWFVFTSRKHNE